MTTTGGDWSSPSDDVTAPLTLLLLPIPALVLACPLMLLVLVVAVGGNVLVLLSYTSDSIMVDAHSLYLVNLAVCDLLLSVLCMPLHVISTLLSAAWPLGPGLCWAHTTLQLILLNVSSHVLVLVALDGLMQARVGVRCTMEEARRKAFLSLTCCWLLAILVHLPVTMVFDMQGLDFAVTFTRLPEHVCRPRFLQQVGQVLLLLVWDFLLPVLVLAVVNLKLYFFLKRNLSATALADKALHHHHHHHQYLQDSVSGVEITLVPTQSATYSGLGDMNENAATQDVCLGVAGKCGTESVEDDARKQTTDQNVCCSQTTVGKKKLDVRYWHDVRYSHSDQTTRGTNTKLPPLSFISFKKPGIQRNRRHVTSRRPHSEHSMQGQSVPPNPACLEKSGGEGSVAGPRGLQREPQDTVGTRGALQMERPRRLKRVALILFMLVLLLAVCWLPYSLTLLLTSLCPACVHPAIYSLVVWLLYCKAAINPFLYAYNTFAFRGRFRRLLARLVPVKRFKRIVTDHVSNERASVLKTAL